MKKRYSLFRFERILILKPLWQETAERLFFVITSIDKQLDRRRGLVVGDGTGDDVPVRVERPSRSIRDDKA